MLDPIMELSEQAENKDKIIKNICHMRVMLKHCQIQDIYKIMAETVFMAIFQNKAQ